MKPVHSRETLCTIDYFPFEDEALTVLVNTYGNGGHIYLTYQCICRYLNLFSKTYQFPTSCSVEKVLLTRKKVCDPECYCEFIEDAENNSYDLLFSLASYCNWNFLLYTDQDLQEAGLNLESEEPLKAQVDKAEKFSDSSKRLLKEFLVNIEATLMDESGFLFILHIRGVREYRQYKKQNPEIIKQKFLREDRIISSILEYADDVLIRDTVTMSCDEDTKEFSLSWTTGSDGYNYVSIASLSPNWLISMYVLHGLLEHAQALFGYSIGGNEKYD